MNKVVDQEVRCAISVLRKFVPPMQLQIMRDGLKGDEKGFFQEKFLDVSELIRGMAKTYEQDGKGDQTVAYLHYFGGCYDAYITERDMEDEQLQAFGYASFGMGFSQGYISIEELKERNVELDLHFDPKTIRELNLK